MTRPAVVAPPATPDRPQRRRHVLRGVALLAVAMLVATGCASTSGAGDDPGDGTGGDEGLVVATSTAVLGDLVAGVVGDAGEVVVLVEPGQDPHTFQLSARQVAELQDVDLLVANGLGLEAAFEDAIDQAEQAGVPVLRVGESLDPLEAGADHDDEHADEQAEDEHADDEHADDEHAEDEHADEEPTEGDGHEEQPSGEVHAADDGHDHGPLDPHVWLDVARMARVPGLVADALDDVAEGPWQEAAEGSAADLEALDAEVAATIAGVPEACRQVAADHDSLAYLAQRYDIAVPVTVIPGTSTDADPSARDFAEGVAVVREAGVSVVVVDDRSSGSVADAFAGEAGIEVLPLPLTAPPASGGYDEMMRTIADGLAAAWSESCG